MTKVIWPSGIVTRSPELRRTRSPKHPASSRTMLSALLSPLHHHGCLPERKGLDMPRTIVQTQSPDLRPRDKTLSDRQREWA